jgi:cellulase (glycosyl hydrolase family 5)
MTSTRVRASVLASALALNIALPMSPAPAEAAGTAPTMASRLAATPAAKSINYYPSGAAWSTMWTEFDAARIDADLAKAAGLGANNVRVIIFPQTFGYPQPKSTYAERLRQFITIADTHGLTVKLTLFDWWDGYADVAGSISWARAILTPYADDRRVIAVGIKNEFQPDDDAAVAWVRRVIPAIRSVVPTMPLTLSVDGQSSSAGIAKIKSKLANTPLDYYDLHFYGASEAALAEIRKAQAAAAPAPVVIGETGLSTASNSEGEQAAYLARVFRAAKEAGLGSVAPWTLNDFADDAIPGHSAVAASPAQYRYGLYRVDGTGKPAAAVVRTAWTTGATPNSVLNLGFEAAAAHSPWRPNLPQAGSAVVTTGMARSGKYSARFSRTSRTSAGLPSLRVSPITPVQPGYRWRAEAYARGSNATGTTEIALSWFDANGKWISQSTSNQLPQGNTGWTKLVVETTAPPRAAGVQLHLKSGDNTGTVYFDDVAVS